MNLLTILLFVLQIGLGLSQQSPPKFYPTILSRGIYFGQIGFYDNLVDVSFSDNVRIPNIFLESEFGSWMKGSRLVEPLAKLINNTYKNLAPPMDHYYFSREIDEAGNLSHIAVIEYGNETANVSRRADRRRRDFPDCTTVLGHAFLSVFETNPCSAGTSEEVKKALRTVVMSQAIDKQALKHVQLSLGENTKIDKELVEELEKLQEMVKKSDETMFGGLASVAQLRKDTFHLFTAMAALIGISNRFRTYANIINSRYQGGIHLDTLPKDIRSEIGEQYKDTAVGAMLKKNMAVLLRPSFKFRYRGYTDGKKAQIVILMDALLPEVHVECKAYKLERLGIESSGSCLTGQEYKDLLIIDCGSGRTWITTKSCLEDCDKIGVRRQVCHRNHCGADQEYQPNWLNDTRRGPLHVDSEHLSFCKRQPTMMSVGQNQYLLTRTANVSYVYLNRTEETKLIEAGSLLKEDCGRAWKLRVDNVTYEGNCKKNDNSIVGRIQVVNHDNLTIVDFNDPDLEKENSTLENELQGLIRELQDRSFADKVEIQHQRMEEMDHYLDADMVKMARNQKLLVDHVRKLQDEKSPVTFSWTDRVLSILIGIIAFAAFLMSACALMMVKPVGGMTAIPVRNMSIRKRKLGRSNSESRAGGIIEASAPMMSVEEMDVVQFKNSKTDPVCGRGARIIDL